MRRILIAAVIAAVAAPMLSGCIIIATDEPVQTSHHRDHD